MPLTRLRAGLLVSLVAALLVLPPLGQRIIASSDEARFALLARDVLQRRAWFDLRVRGRQYRNKPPLYPWSIALFSLPRGRVTAASAQAPVALAAVGTALLTFLLGDRLFGRRAGVWASLGLSASYGFFAHTQLLLPDMLVLCFMTLAGYAFWRAVSDPPARGALVGFYAALALGVFAKGPIGLLPVVAAGAWLWTEHGARGLRRLWSPFGLGVFALITLVWLAPFLALGAPSFGETVLWQDWLGWYLGLPAPGALGDLAVDALVLCLPWTFLAPLTLAAALRARGAPAVRFALLWFLAPLLVILLAANQRTRYLLPLLPGLALLVGWWADTHGAVRTTARRVFGWVSLSAAALALGALAVRRDLWPEELGPYVPGLSWAVVPLVIGVALVGAALFVGLRAGRPAFLVHGAVIGMIVILSYGVWPYTKRFNELWDFPRLAAMIERHARGGEAAVFGGNVYGGRWFSMDFYLGHPLRSVQTIGEFNAYVARPERPLVVVRGAIWRTVLPEITPNVRILDRMTVGGQDMLLVKGTP